MKTLVALIPLLGFVQFWLQTDYLPRTQMPLVDVSTDLTSTGATGDIVHLEAKVTFNNRSSVPVNVGGTLDCGLRHIHGLTACGAKWPMPSNSG